jgi:hypothetical protein
LAGTLHSPFRDHVEILTVTPRNDAPSGLWLVVGDIGGVRLSKSFTATKEGVPRITNKSKAEKLTVAPGEQAYVTFGAGLSTQRLNNALAPSALFTMGAAHGEVSVAGGWVCELTSFIVGQGLTEV